MFAARIGVGVGEATLSPAAYSMLSDYFPPHRLTRALSVYQTAIYVGTGLAMIIGGAMIAVVPAIDMPFYGHMEPWQVVFLIVGLPGILVAILMWTTVREPERKGLLARGGNTGAIPFPEVLKLVVERRRAYGYFIGGVAAKSLAFYGVGAWIPTFFMRTYEWDVATVGLWYGVTSIVFGIVGINSGGSLSVWMRERGDVDANVRVSMIAEAMVIPFGVLAPLMPSGVVSMLLFGGFVFFASFSVGCQAAALQEITPNQMRAQVSALYLFMTNLCGIGLGPTFVAFFTDIVFGGDLSVKYSMSVATAVACPIGVFLFWRSMKPYRACLELAARGFRN
jgi:predicted MFS family arabinose efflux permease